METVTTLPRGRAFTRRDLEGMPDDGHRYELIDGTLLVTPAPSPKHQTVVLELAVLLRNTVPSDLKVMVAPLDVALGPATVIQPDLLIARRDAFSEVDLAGAPLLAVEVLSASTRRVDLTLKKSTYEAAGCASYWVVDPEVPSLTAWELRDQVYVKVAHVVGEEAFPAKAPYDAVITPASLVG